MFEKTNHTITITKLIIVKQKDTRLTTYTYMYMYMYVLTYKCTCTCMYTRLQFCHTIKQHYSVAKGSLTYIISSISI